MINTYKLHNEIGIIFVFKFLKPEYTLNNEEIASQIFEIIKQIFESNFDVSNQIFQTEKQNLIDDINSLGEDKRYLASLKLKEIMNQGIDKITENGEIKVIQKLTKDEVIDYLKNIIKNSNLEIKTSLDKNLINQNKVFNNFVIEDFSKIKEKKHLFLTKDNSSEYDFNFDNQQSLINIGIDFKKELKDKDKLIFDIFNNIFGNNANSRLFKIIREKYSLAYYISSRVNISYDYVEVYSGIKKSKKDKILNLVKEILLDMQTNLVSDNELKEAKSYEIDKINSANDSLSSFLNLEKIISIYKFKDVQDYINFINNISKDDILKIANYLNQTTTIFYKGSN